MDMNMSKFMDVIRRITSFQLSIKSYDWHSIRILNYIDYHLFLLLTELSQMVSMIIKQTILIIDIFFLVDQCHIQTDNIVTAATTLSTI